MRKVLTAVLTLLVVPAVAVAAEESPAPAPVQAVAPAVGQAQAQAPAAAAPASATAPGDGKAAIGPSATVTATAEERQRRGGFHWGVNLNHSVGQGTFEDASMYADVGGALGLNGTYGFEAAGIQFSSSASANMSLEYSLPDNDAARRFHWSDIRLGLSAPAIFKDEKVTGISITPSFSASVPISLTSRWQNMVTSTSLGVSAMRPFGSKVVVNLSVGASKGFFYRSPGVTPDQAKEIRDQQQNQLFLCRPDDVDCIGGIQALYSVSTGLGVSYRPIEKLSLSLGFGLSKSVKPAQPIDEFTTRAKYTDGRPVAVEVGTSDMMSGSLSASYALTDNVGLSASMSTGQQPKYNGDNKFFRFPFFGFEGQERSVTSYALSVSAQF